MLLTHFRHHAVCVVVARLKKTNTVYRKKTLMKVSVYQSHSIVLIRYSSHISEMNTAIREIISRSQVCTKQRSFDSRHGISNVCKSQNVP